MEESGSSNKVVEPYLQILSSATECVPKRSLQLKGKQMINDHGVLIETITEISRIQEYVLPICRIIFMNYLSC